MKNLSGKHVLITGGTCGIGAAIAKRFFEEGSRVAVLGRDRVALEEIKKELPQLEATFSANVAIIEDVNRVFTHLDQMRYELDVLINNAGISICKSDRVAA